MASSATVGSAVVKLKFDGKDVKSGLSAVEKETNNFGAKASGVFKNIAKSKCCKSETVNLDELAVVNLCVAVINSCNLCSFLFHICL